MLIAVGTRFSDRVALNPKTFAKNATIIQPPQLDYYRAVIDIETYRKRLDSVYLYKMSSVNNYMNGIYDNNISCRSCMFCDYVFYNKAKW